MSYNDIENSISDGAPFYLYRFNINGTIYRYTSRLTSYTWIEPGNQSNTTFDPSAITHGDLKISQELVKNKLTILVPLDNAVAQLYLTGRPESTVSVIVYRTHAGNATPIVLWKGRVTSDSPQENQMALECMPISNSLNRPGLRMRYQRHCIHSVYDSSGCKVSKASMAVAGTATLVSTNTVTVTEASGYAKNYFTGGMLLAPDGTYRFIRAHSGDAITLIRPIDSLTEEIATNGNTAVTLYPGCDKSRQTCNDKFSNLGNYLGFDWIPTTNPFGGSSIL